MTICLFYATIILAANAGTYAEGVPFHVTHPVGANTMRIILQAPVSVDSPPPRKSVLIRPGDQPLRRTTTATRGRCVAERQADFIALYAATAAQYITVQSTIDRAQFGKSILSVNCPSPPPPPRRSHPGPVSGRPFGFGVRACCLFACLSPMN